MKKKKKIAENRKKKSKDYLFFVSCDTSTGKLMSSIQLNKEQQFSFPSLDTIKVINGKLLIFLLSNLNISRRKTIYLFKAEYSVFISYFFSSKQMQGMKISHCRFIAA